MRERQPRAEQRQFVHDRAPEPFQLVAERARDVRGEVTGSPYAITNPGFENGAITPTAWQMPGWAAAGGGTWARDTTVSRSGTASLKLQVGTTNGYSYVNSGALADRFRLVVPDLLGHGRSPVRADGNTRVAMADDLGGLVESLEPDRWSPSGTPWAGRWSTCRPYGIPPSSGR